MAMAALRREGRRFVIVSPNLLRSSLLPSPEECNLTAEELDGLRRMATKLVSLRYFYEGVFDKTTYLGGRTYLLNRLPADELSYTVMIEYVKDYLKYTEIGGVYAWKGKIIGWKLLKIDTDFLELVDSCKHDDEVPLYVDTTVDKNIEPLYPGVPWVVQRPRKNIFAGAPGAVKRAFVSSHQLQQQRNSKKIPRSPQMQDLPQVLPANTRGNAKRKLELPKDSNVELQSLNPYELSKLKRVQENKKMFKELGLGKYASNSSQLRVDKSQEKNKSGEKADEEYVPVENGSGTDTSDSVEGNKSVKRRIGTPGPRTRSRANAADVGDKDTRNAIEKEGKDVSSATEKRAPSATVRAKLLKPTCSKLLKVGDNSVPSGSVAAYIALRDRQNQNLAADPRIEVDVGESSLQPLDEAVEAGPKKCRERSKMFKVHGRKPENKVIIKVNKRGQPIGNRKIRAELSNFLGTVVKDHVSITYVNWHVVPEALKQKMLEYALDKYIIPQQGEKWVLKTFNSLWRTHKSRMKTAHYTKYDTDEERIQNRPDQIPLEEFKMLLKYWSDEGVQSMAEDNTTRRISYVETHTLGPKSLAEVKNNMKNKDPTNASPCDAKMFFKSRKRKPGRKYKSNPDEINKKLKGIEDKLIEGNDADVILPRKKESTGLVGGKAR